MSIWKCGYLAPFANGKNPPIGGIFPHWGEISPRSQWIFLNFWNSHEATAAAPLFPLVGFVSPLGGKSPHSGGFALHSTGSTANHPSATICCSDIVFVICFCLCVNLVLQLQMGKHCFPPFALGKNPPLGRNMSPARGFSPPFLQEPRNDRSGSFYSPLDRNGPPPGGMIPPPGETKNARGDVLTFLQEHASYEREISQVTTSI